MDERKANSPQSTSDKQGEEPPTTMNVMMMCDAGPSSRPLIENLDRFNVHELEQMRERQMKIVNRPRRVAAPPSDETERRRARQKVETIELRLSALRAEEEMSNPRDHTDDIADQIDLMNVGKPVQVNLKVKSKLSTRPYGMVATDPGSPTSPHGHVNGFRPAMSEAEAMQIQREAYVLASAKKEADEQRKALHAEATNTRGISDEEKRRRILAYMSFKGESDDEDDDDDDDMDDDDEDGGDLFGEYDDGEFDMEADDYGLGGIIQVDRSRYANFGD